MNLKQLEAFKAIMSTGSTIDAATRMGLSQPAISRLLGQLEESLGFALFLRRKGRLAATPEAEAFLPEVSGLVDNMQRVQRMANDLRLGHSRRQLLRVAVPTSMTQHLLPRVVSEFMRGREDLVIEVLTGSYDTLERAVLDRSADFAFVRLPTEMPGFEVLPVLKAKGVCVLPQGHALAAKPVINARDLRDVPLVLLGRQRNLRTEMDQMFRDAHIIPNVRMEVHSVSAACAFVAEGMGVSIINELLANDFASLPVVTRPFLPVLSYSFGLVLRDDIPRTPVADEFMALFTDSLLAAMPQVPE
ncbi:MAG: LysR family transcriptional regulator [Pseudomonas sp.]|uniref:LysR family transcriptional regulator n=1 Tax=Pseudomonas abieticivorans TaxID=2931382 RepID=UPI0020BE985F|nr:LysR family transcriptional regulator [Pseudomonas sp. PIA16]MDE1166158.1 LysR family transcriptional regulator [Pseudomonas sp.]